MARTTSNLILQGLKGGLDKQLVIKQYSYGTVVTKYPDMEDIEPSVLQQLERNKFREATAYAQSINRNPVTKAEWKAKLPPGTSVFHAAMKEYLSKH